MVTHYLVSYDISEDDVRFSIADICKNFGLVRIQYSVFYGELQRSQVKTMKLQLDEMLTNGNGDIHIIKVCDSCEPDHVVLSSIGDDLQTIENTYQEVSEELEKEQGVIIL